MSVLGSALVLMAFVTGLARVLGRPAGKVAALEGFRARVHRPSAGAIQVGVAVIGTILTGVALAVVATGGLPDLARASVAQLGHTYTAPVPGPNCDTGGATWFVAPGEPVTTRCGRSGLLATVPPHAGGDVTFQPPDGFTSPNYRISVTVKFSRFDGCASIYTRSSTVGRYLNILCSSDNSAGIKALNVNTKRQALLVVGFARPASSYTLMTVTDGTRQSFFVNGTKVGTVVNKEFPVTINVGLVLLNLSGSPGSAVFSHFMFTPLPGSPHT
jgi:hypothetical protein